MQESQKVRIFVAESSSQSRIDSGLACRWLSKRITELTKFCTQSACRDETAYREAKMTIKSSKCLKPFLILFSLTIWGQISNAHWPKAKSAFTESISTEDKNSIRKTVAGVEEAWNTHDMKAYGDLLTEDVQWVNVVGMQWRGHKAVLYAHIAFHKTIFKDHQVKTDTVEIRSLGSGIALAVVTTTNDQFTTPDGSVVPKMQYRQTYVLRESSDAWKITHCHNVPVDPIAAKFDPVNATH